MELRRQHFHVGGPSEAVGAINACPSEDLDVSVSTAVSDRFVPSHDKLLPARQRTSSTNCSTTTRTSASWATTSDGGVSGQVFALYHLLGFRFVSCILNLADQHLVTRVARRKR
ncbi:Tn3 family transposase [Geminicoccus roseus]|uniref:Tn3 family transposase n=1 Tax=Geminicoccus roseus TaxID=404900 RepID=UPI0012FB8C94